ncbi:MAG: hypothetical protein V8S27_02720 [Lachnospiraceae bacterium]
MEALWNAYPVLQGILEIPDYYASDSKFYFGKLVSTYLEGEKTEEIQRIAPEVGEVIEEILHENDSEEEKEYCRQRAELAKTGGGSLSGARESGRWTGHQPGDGEVQAEEKN